MVQRAGGRTSTQDSSDRLTGHEDPESELRCAASVSDWRSRESPSLASAALPKRRLRHPSLRHLPLHTRRLVSSRASVSDPLKTGHR